MSLAGGERLSEVKNAKFMHKGLFSASNPLPRACFLLLAKYSACSVADIMQMFLMFYLRNYEASHFSLTVMTAPGVQDGIKQDHMLPSPFICVCAPAFCVSECSSVLCLECDITLQKRVHCCLAQKQRNVN